jgi:hypothetical protein
MAKLAAIDSGRIIGLFRVVVRMDAGNRASAPFEYSGERPRVHIPACPEPATIGAGAVSAWVSECMTFDKHDLRRMSPGVG